MALGADAADRRAGLEKTLDQPHEGRPLRRVVLKMVLVDEQRRFRIGLLGVVERQGHVLVDAQIAGPDRLAKIDAVVLDGFVDHVPAGGQAPVTPRDGENIVAIGVSEPLALAVQLDERGHPLVVPDQGGAIEPHAVAPCEVGDGVGAIETEASVVLEDVFHLHLPLGRELGVVASQQLSEGRFVQLVALHAGADRCRGDGFQGHVGDGRERRCLTGGLATAGA